jgi:hypothetical protein
MSDANKVMKWIPRRLMDRSLNVEGQILFQAGTHADAVSLNFRDWYEMVNPQVATFSEPGDVVRSCMGSDY